MNDDLDDELRRLFSDDRLDVLVTPDATDAVVRGADRRRRRRTAVTGAFAVVALIGAGVGLTQLRPSADDTAGPLLPTSSSSASAAPPPPPSTYTSTVTVTVDPPTPGGTGTANPPGGTNPPRSSSKPSTAKPPPPTPEAAPPVWSKLSLGMSHDDAVATGELGRPGASGNEACRFYGLKPGDGYIDVGINLTTGIVRINLPASGRTSKNIGAGSTVAEAKAAYPTATQNGSDLIVPMTATPMWEYVFQNDGTNVTAVIMRVAANDVCLSR